MVQGDRSGKASVMTTRILRALCAALTLSLAASGHRAAGEDVPPIPSDYREWVYLSTGFDMSYSKVGWMMGHHMFDNVFVDPASYRAFLETGTWPDKTRLVSEARGATGKGSINQSGYYQSTELMGLEMHIKDEARFPGGWAFVAYDGSKAELVPPSADCYSCHQAHAAVDTTFVQFYPTLLSIAQQKGTLSASYRAETR
jgi:hypothetical protein